MSRDPRLFLEDILEACERIRDFTQGVSKEDFQRYRMRFDAVVRNIELLGEAARQLPEEVIHAIAEVAWKEIIAMRNVLIHVYFDIDTDIVWDVVTTKIHGVHSAVTEYLRQ